MLLMREAERNQANDDTSWNDVSVGRTLIRGLLMRRPVPLLGGGGPGWRDVRFRLWHIDSGTIQGVDVSGLTFAISVHIPGNVFKGNWRALAYVDDQATPAQQDALLSVFTGKLGGPMPILLPCSVRCVASSAPPPPFHPTSAK